MTSLWSHRTGEKQKHRISFTLCIQMIKWRTSDLRVICASWELALKLCGSLCSEKSVRGEMFTLNVERDGEGMLLVLLFQRFSWAVCGTESLRYIVLTRLSVILNFQGMRFSTAYLYLRLLYACVCAWCTKLLRTREFMIRNYQTPRQTALSILFLA